MVLLATIIFSPHRLMETLPLEEMLEVLVLAVVKVEPVILVMYYHLYPIMM
jgi:hypothetical protein